MIKSKNGKVTVVGKVPTILEDFFIIVEALEKGGGINLKNIIDAYYNEKAKLKKEEME